MRRYEQQESDVENATFTLFTMSCTGGYGRAATRRFRNMTVSTVGGKTQDSLKHNVSLAPRKMLLQHAEELHHQKRTGTAK